MPPSLPALAVIAERLRDDAASALDRRALIQVLASMGGADAALLLWEQAGDLGKDLITAGAAIWALRAIRIREELYRLPLRGLRQRWRELVSLVSLYNRAREALAREDPFAAQAFEDHARAGVLALLAMTSLRHRDREMDRVLVNLFSDVPALGARAVELLDEVLPRPAAIEVSALLMPLLDEPSPGSDGITAQTLAALAGCEPWIRAVVHRARRGRGSGKATFSLTPLERDIANRLDTVAPLKKIPLFAKVPAYQLLASRRGQGAARDSGPADPNGTGRRGAAHPAAGGCPARAHGGDPPDEQAGPLLRSLAARLRGLKPVPIADEQGEAPGVS